MNLILVINLLFTFWARTCCGAAALARFHLLARMSLGLFCIDFSQQVSLLLPSGRAEEKAAGGPKEASPWMGLREQPELVVITPPKRRVFK